VISFLDGALLVVELCFAYLLVYLLRGCGLLVYSGDRRLEICFVIRNIV